LLLPGDIGVDEGLPRLYHTIRTVYKRVKPDFAFYVNDHTFVIPEHLCAYLESRDPDRDLYAGHALKQGENDMFNSGAAGYLLSRETMKKLIQKWDAQDPNCLLDKEGSSAWLQGNPGLVTVKCLDAMGIRAIDTRAEHKYHRFHAFPLTRVILGEKGVDQWYVNKHQNVDRSHGGFDAYGTLLAGPDCCSADTVSFHYVEYKESRALFAVRNALLRNRYMSDKDLMHLMLELWPSEHKEIGGYSRGLPGDRNKQAWSDLLKTIRKISTKETQRDC
jgi:hypothetical protein